MGRIMITIGLTFLFLHQTTLGLKCYVGSYGSGGGIFGPDTQLLTVLQCPNALDKQCWKLDCTLGSASGGLKGCGDVCGQLPAAVQVGDQANCKCYHCAGEQCNGAIRFTGGVGLVVIGALASLLFMILM